MNPSRYLSTVLTFISLPSFIMVFAILFADTRLPILSIAKLATFLSIVSSCIFFLVITSFIIISLYTLLKYILTSSSVSNDVVYGSEPNEIYF